MSSIDQFPSSHKNIGFKELRYIIYNNKHRYSIPVLVYFQTSPWIQYEKESIFINSDLGNLLVMHWPRLSIILSTFEKALDFISFDFLKITSIQT